MAKVNHQSVSVVITVLNESETVGSLCTALKSQTAPPREVIIVDGGSTDNTLNILHQIAGSWPVLKVFQYPGNRSICRNFGVSKSSSPIIAFTDAGCIPDADWLKYLLEPFQDPDVQVVSGYYYGIAFNIFQKCLIPYVLVMPDKAGRNEFFPATRSMALRRSAWQKSGGFDPQLYHNEDFAFAYKLKSLGFTFIFTPKAQVGWYPRQNLKQAAWMFMRFAIGDIQAGIIRPQVKSLATRYLIAVFIFFLCLEIPPLFILFFILTLIYLILAIVKNYKYVNDLRAFWWLPILQITADLSVLFGTIVGGLSRYMLINKT